MKSFSPSAPKAVEENKMSFDGGDESFRCFDGYDADSESENSPSKETRRTKRKTEEFQADNLSCSLFCQPYGRRRKLAADCSWIERIYSSTPFATPEESDTIPIFCNPNDMSLSRDSRSSEKSQKASALDPIGTDCECIMNVSERHDVQDSLPSFSNVTAGTPSPPFVVLGKAGSLMDTLNLQTLDDELLIIALLTVVNALLRDSYKIQATYRSKSLNGASKGNLFISEPR
ncbi:hypothetical protein IV203_031012 [Nitzschia inconspicua]|uniref:Uncharacterized protein n=1 Tax=Nitzschia inconspicua TaxID=303405 RepID=A0A9K3LTG0_9STRA|nr:hypothetical protein IV203_031012 [Nitzschia inconspicua]